MLRPMSASAPPKRSCPSASELPTRVTSRPGWTSSRTAPAVGATRGFGEVASSVRARLRALEHRMLLHRGEAAVEFVAEMLVKEWAWSGYQGLEPSQPDQFGRRMRREGFTPPGVNAAIGYLRECREAGEIPKEKTLLAKALPQRQG
jgi:hypothetical protein